MNNDVGKFLGERIISVKFDESPFKAYKRKDWILWFVSNYGYIDGEEHKQWLIDQIAQICLGVKVIIKLAEWESGHTEYRVTLGEPNKAYKNWAGGYGPPNDGSGWDQGIAP